MTTRSAGTELRIVRRALQRLQRHPDNHAALLVNENLKLKKALKAVHGNEPREIPVQSELAALKLNAPPK